MRLPITLTRSLFSGWCDMDYCKSLAGVFLEQAHFTPREVAHALSQLNDGLPRTKKSVRTLVSCSSTTISLMRDRGRIGTGAYAGLASFWAYKYRFWMRGDAHANGYRGISIERARRKIHDTFVAENLPLNGETARHDKIINDVFCKYPQKSLLISSPGYTQ